ncbi:MAG: AAA family ATPase [Myxococcota bacterium]
MHSLSSTDAAPILPTPSPVAPTDDAQTPPGELSPVDACRIRLPALLARLDQSLLERSTHVRLALLALLSGQHVLLLGPPGTAKSLLARAICRCFRGTHYFEYLLTRFTHPDELFGPVSVPGLKEEDFRRLTTGYLPQAHVAFLDEIFKANSAILNSLLTLCNERIFHHGRHRDVVPLLGMVGASNEPPDPEGGLGALFDRFLVRLSVMPLELEASFLQVTLGEVQPFEPPAADQLELAWLLPLRQAAAQVQASPEIRGALVALRQTFQTHGIDASDRRWRQALELLKLAALTSGRTELALCDLLLLEHCFGDPLTQGPVLAQSVRQVVGASVRPPVAQDALEQAWRHLAQPLELTSPDQQRRERLEQVRDAQLALSQQVEHFESHRQALQSMAQVSPWLPPLPPTVLAGFVTAQRQLLLEQQTLTQAQGQLEAFDPTRESFKLLLGKETGSRYGMGRKKALFWTRTAEDGPGAEPESWLPWGADGLAQDPRLAFEELAQKLEGLSKRAGGLPLGSWHSFVPVITLDATGLYALLHQDEHGIQRDGLVRTACYEVEDRLRVLEEQLRLHTLIKDQRLEQANPKLYSIYEQVQLRRWEELNPEKQLKPPALEEVTRAFSAWLKRVHAVGLASPPPPPARPSLRESSALTPERPTPERPTPNSPIKSEPFLPNMGELFPPTPRR